MTRSLTLLALMTLTGVAHAAAPHPTAVDKDGDGAYVATVDINGDGKLDHLDIGVSEKEYDCDDNFDTVSPFNREIVGDNIDNDCSSGIPVDHVKGDLKFPVSSDELTRWKANWPIKWDDVGFVTSYDRLDASAHVTIVKLADGTTDGTFTVADGYQVGDWITGALPADREFSQVRICPDGALEVFSDTEVAYLKDKTGSCSSSRTRSSGDGRGYVNASVAVLRLEDEADRLAQAERDAEQDLVIDSLGETVMELVAATNDNTKSVGQMNKAMGVLRDDLDLETARRHKADIYLAEQVDEVRDLVEGAPAPLIEVGLVAGGVFGRPIVITQDEESAAVRGGVIGGGGFELRAGVDTSDWQIAGFGQLSFGSDGVGTGSDRVILIGADVLRDVGSVEVGGWVAYVQTESKVNAVQASVLENGGLIGLTVQGDIASGVARVVPFARVGAGFGKHAFKVEEGVVTSFGPMAVAQAGIRFGAGAK